MRPIIENENGDYEVLCPNGDRVPAALFHEEGDTGWIRCPVRCSLETHRHGRPEKLMSHRVAHCGEDRKEERAGGYYLLREKPPALLTVRAASAPRPATSFGFGSGTDDPVTLDVPEGESALLAGVF